MALLVGRTAPDFVATAVKGKKIIDKFRLSDLKGKNIVLFSTSRFYICLSDRTSCL